MELNSRPEKRAFAKMAFLLILPIVGQNMLNMIVNAADVIMLGKVSQTALAASSQANQVQFILSLVFYGIGSGASVLAAQYWGKGDTRTIEVILGIAIRLSMSMAALFGAASILFPHALMTIFTPDAELIAEGAVYLRVLGVSFLLMGISTMYLNVMRSIERVSLSTVVYAVSLVVNILLNAVLIFGLFGFPALGILGAAIATCIARMVEVLICVVDTLRYPLVRIRITCIFTRNKVLFRDFMRYTLPALGNDVIWGAGFATYSIIMGYMSSDMVAANSIAQVVRNIARIACTGIATGAAIIIGKTLGQSLTDHARVYAKRLVHATLLAGLFGSVLILILRPILMSYGQITPQARDYLGLMMFISAYYIHGTAINTTLICGIFRAGGDTKFGFYLDIIDMWIFAIPAGFLCAFVLRLPVMWVYFILFLDEFVKMPFVIARYKSMRWLRNITRDNPVEESADA